MFDDYRDLAETLLAPIAYMLEPGKRVFAPWLALSTAMAFLIYWRRYSAPSSVKLSNFVRWAFPKRIWLHRSAWLDYQLVIVNAVWRTLIITPLLFPATAMSAVVITLLQVPFGEPLALSCSRPVVGVSYTLLLFLVGDFSRYLLHRMLHQVPFLWAFHQVHHSAEVLTPFTVYRSHPVESLLYMVRRVFSVGIVTGLSFFVFADALHGYDVLGINVIGLFFNALGANLRHSHVWLSYGPLERLLISPAQHQIHHSCAPEHHHKNYGLFLAVWDYAGGSLYRSGDKESLTFGLEKDCLNRHSDLFSALLYPLLDGFKFGRRRMHD